MDVPETLRYTEDHEWIRVEDDGTTATIGVTDFAQGELGDVVYVDLEPVGTELSQGDNFGSVEAVKTVADLYMPVSGTLTAHNDDLEDHPEQVNDDPYGDGWMVRIEISDASELDDLLTADAYGEMIS